MTSRRWPRSLAGLLVVVTSALLSVASTEGGTGGESACGALEVAGAEGDACTDRSECTEVCCFCDGSGEPFVARGCDLDEGVCYGGDVLCQLALDDDPSLCPAE